MNVGNVLIHHEINQSLIRLSIVSIIFLYVLLYTYFDIETDFNNFSFLLIIFISISFLEFVWSIFYFRNQKETKHNVIFRIFTNIIDNILLAVAMIKMGSIGAPLFIIYLWITFGIGIRYGALYLLTSTLLNIFSFYVVINLSSFWHNESIVFLSAGLLISLVILPMYVYFLILKLSNALKAEKKANKIKKIFLENINHEFRTPLNSIFNVIELMGAQSLTSRNYRMLNMIYFASNDLKKMINRVLDFSKIESKEYKIKTISFNLYSLLNEIVFVIVPQAKIKDINIYIDPDCDPCFNGAYDDLKIILTNMVSNAVKFTNCGYVLISVGLEREDEISQ